jgi:hypothetical protein
MSEQDDGTAGERSDSGWAPPDRPAPSYASDWPQAPSGRPPLPPPGGRPGPLPPPVVGRPTVGAPPLGIQPSPLPPPGRSGPLPPPGPLRPAPPPGQPPLPPSAVRRPIAPGSPVPPTSPYPQPMRITLPPGVPPPHVPGPAPWTGAVRQPGGLIPAGPPRPIYREPGPVRFGPLAVGTGSGALWMLLFGLLASTTRGYVWLTFGSGLAAWLTAVVLARLGDRGAAVGVALSTGVGVAIAGMVVVVQWASGHWLLW